jgi:hypothetical protein
MQDPVRRAVALIGASAVSGKRASSVYDHQASRHFTFSLTLSGGAVTAYDNSEQCQIGARSEASSTTAPKSTFNCPSNRVRSTDTITIPESIFKEP